MRPRFYRTSYWACVVLAACGARSGLGLVDVAAVAGGGSSGAQGGTTGDGGFAGDGVQAGSAGSAGTSGGAGRAGAGSGGLAGGSGPAGSGGEVPDASTPCGNRVVDTGEECDDGNQASGDGCSARCRYEVAAVTGATCVLSTGGTVKCWGSNLVGESGLGDTRTRGDEPGEMGANLAAVDLGTGRRALSIVAGGSQTPSSGHVCAVLDDGGLKCWGSNGHGELGLGDSANRGDDPGEMGDNLPEIQLGSGRRVTAVAAGWYHTCALLDGGALKCWGLNDAGQLGVTDLQSRGYKPGQMGDALPVIDLGLARHAVRITAGKQHTCAVLDDDSLKCWGDNGADALGLGSYTGSTFVPGPEPAVELGSGRHAVRIGAGNADSCALLDDGSMKCWGNDIFGELGARPQVDANRHQRMGDSLPALALGADALGLAVGGIHTCALLVGGVVKCWGYGADGELGIPDPGTGSPDAAVVLGTGRSARSLSTSYIHTCAVLDDGSLKCWGGNQQGTLGLGDTRDRGTARGDMGDNLPAVDLGL